MDATTTPTGSKRRRVPSLRSLAASLKPVRRPPALSRAALWRLTAGTISVFLLVGIAWVNGFRWFDVRTPSMGQAAPVGTLVITRAVDLSEVSKGELITFRPWNSDQTYTHRVIHAAPYQLRTQGDINGSPDPWVVTPDTLVGVVVARWWGMGYLMRALPTLMIGWLLLWVFTHCYFPISMIGVSRLVGASLVFSLTALWMQPWVKAVMLGQLPRDGGIAADIVPTGVMPITVEAGTGDAKDALPGQVVQVFSAHADENGVHAFNPHLNLTGWWLVGVCLACSLPLLYVLVVGLRDPEEVIVRSYRPRPRRLREVSPTSSRVRALGGQGVRMAAKGVETVGRLAENAVLASCRWVGDKATWWRR